MGLFTSYNEKKSEEFEVTFLFMRFKYIFNNTKKNVTINTWGWGFKMMFHNAVVTWRSWWWSRLGFCVSDEALAELWKDPAEAPWQALIKDWTMFSGILGSWAVAASASKTNDLAFYKGKWASSMYCNCLKVPGATASVSLLGIKLWLYVSISLLWFGLGDFVPCPVEA